MPKLTDDPAVIALIEKRVATALKKYTAAAVAGVKALSAEHLEGNADLPKPAVVAHKGFLREAIARIKGAGAEG